jgi:hypothetical protein
MGYELGCCDGQQWTIDEVRNGLLGQKRWTTAWDRRDGLLLWVKRVCAITKGKDGLFGENKRRIPQGNTIEPYATREKNLCIHFVFSIFHFLLVKIMAPWCTEHTGTLQPI